MGRHERALTTEFHTTNKHLQVSAGHREPINPRMPAPLRQLISDLWAGLPELRPSMNEAAGRLRDILADTDVLAEADAATSPGGGCCSLM